MIVKTPIPNSSYLKIGSVHHFLCSCGDVDFYKESLISLVYHPKHTCSKCGNTYYLDVVTFLYDASVLYWKTLKLDYIFEKEKSGWVAKAILKVPLFNVSKQKIELESIVLVSYSLHYNKYLRTVDEKYHNRMPMLTRKCFFLQNVEVQNILEECAKKVRPTFYDKVIDTLPTELKWLKDVLPSIDASHSRNDIVKYYLKYPELDSFEFYYWVEVGRFEMHKSVECFKTYILNERKEKSLKDAYDLSYKEAIDAKCYDPLADYMFSRRIKGVHNVLKCIQIPAQIKSALFENITVKELDIFFDFLERHYVEHDIIQLWLDINYEDTDAIIPNIFRIFLKEGFYEILTIYFRGTDANIYAIHKEFSRIYDLYYRRRIKERLVLDYDISVLKTVGKYKGLVFTLAYEVKELSQWLGSLKNCRVSYAKKIGLNECIIYGVFSLYDKRMLCVIEVRNQKLIQVCSVDNRCVSDEQMMKIEGWVRQVFQ